MKTHPPIIRLLLALSLIPLSGSNALATEWVHADLGAARTTIEVGDSKFTPVMPRLDLGLSLMDGIMLELQYAGTGDDTDAGTNIEIADVVAAYLRMETVIRSHVRLYLLLGNAETTLNVQGSAGPTAGSGTYKDFSWGIGMEEQFGSEYSLLTLEYTEYYNHDEVVISALSIGFKLEY